MGLFEAKLGERRIKIPVPPGWTGQLTLTIHKGEIVFSPRDHKLVEESTHCGDCGSVNVGTTRRLTGADARFEGPQEALARARG